MGLNLEMKQRPVEKEKMLQTVTHVFLTAKSFLGKKDFLLWQFQEKAIIYMASKHSKLMKGNTQQHAVILYS